MRAVQELLGAPTIGGGVPGPGVVVGVVKEVKKAFHVFREVRKQRQNRRFPALIALKIAKNAVFYLKVLNKIYS